MIKIIIADDHEIFLEGLVSLLKEEDNIEIVGAANNGKAVIPLLEENTIDEGNTIDVAVLDINMPEMDGIDLSRYIKSNFPTVKILILTMHNEIKFIRRVLEAGAHGYILKNKGKKELLTAIKTVYDTGQCIGEEVNNILISSMRTPNIQGRIKLTKREREVLEFIAKGLSTPEIAKKLSRANTTINSHRQNLIEKTGVKNSKELILFAIENGYD